MARCELLMLVHLNFLLTLIDQCQHLCKQAGLKGQATQTTFTDSKYSVVLLKLSFLWVIQSDRTFILERDVAILGVRFSLARGTGANKTQTICVMRYHKR